MQTENDTIITNENFDKKTLINVNKATEQALNRFDMAMQLAERGYRKQNDFHNLKKLELNKENMKAGFVNGYINALVEYDHLKIEGSC